MSDEQKDQMKWACKNGDVAAATALVAADATLASANLSGGRAAIHYAGDMGQTDVVKYLVETAGVDVNTKDDNGMDALISAVYELHKGTVEFLIGAGATGHKDSKAPDGSTYKEAAATVDAPKDLVDLL